MNLPTRTQINSWRVDHLDSAAEEWTRRAEAWERAYSAVVREVTQPGGTSWEGAAAQAAAQRVITDRRTVLHAADSLHDVAAIARSGATDIRVAQALAQNRIYSAQRADFSIQEDLSIIDNGLSSTSDRKREAVAMRHAENIWHAAQALDTTDRTVAKRLIEAIEDLEALQFPTERSADLTNAVMATFTGSLPPLPSAPHLIYCYPSARPDFWWCEGYDVGGGPYGFDSPIDVSGVG
jgi:hypothetical protein